MKRFISLMLAIGLLLSVFCVSGCVAETEIDKNKTQLYIGVTDGGLGREYIENYIKDYEAIHQDVQIIPSYKKTEYQTDMLKTNMPYNKQDVYFLWSCDYQSFAANNLLLDITDITTEKAYDADGELSENGTLSIADRFKDEIFTTHYNLGTKDAPKYYGLPFYSFPVGIIYDADLFESKSLYFTSDGTIGAKSTDADLGAGPDGVSGTLDDGLAPTWNDFMELLQYMRSASIIPFTWCGAFSYQKEYVIQSIIANYSGKDNYTLNYSLNGHESDLDEDINVDSGYLLGAQPGKKAALKAAYDILSNSENYSSKAFFATQTHTMAEQEFLQSVDGVGDPIAMLFEGGYWETEAKPVFDGLEKQNADWGYGKRNFKLMTIPRFIDTEGVEDQTNDRSVLTMSYDTSMICISKDTSVPDIAKDFVKFVLSRTNMAKFTMSTGAMFNYNYEMKPEEIAGCTTFVKDIYQKYSDANIDKVYDVILSDHIKSNMAYFGRWVAESSVGTSVYSDAFTAIYNNNKATFEQIWDDSVSYRQNTWNK